MPFIVILSLCASSVFEQICNFFHVLSAAQNSRLCDISSIRGLRIGSYRLNRSRARTNRLCLGGACFPVSVTGGHTATNNGHNLVV